MRHLFSNLGTFNFFMQIEKNDLLKNEITKCIKFKIASFTAKILKQCLKFNL